MGQCSTTNYLCVEDDTAVAKQLKTGTAKMVQTRSMTKAAAAKQKVAKGADKLEAAKKAASEAVGQRSLAAAERLLAGTKKVAADKLAAARATATEAVRQRSLAAAERLLAAKKVVAGPEATKVSTVNTPAELSEFEKGAIATMRRLLDEQAAGINRDERISRTFPLMEYLMTAGGEYLMTGSTFRTTVDQKIQGLLMEGAPVKLAILLCRVHQKYFP